MKDLLGKAMLDFYHGKDTEKLITETNISDADELPLPYLFRSYSEMPLIEQKALELCKGHVLDVGCGAGSHSLYLQKKNHDVTAIDISEGACEVARLRGVQNVIKTSILALKEPKFDTILILMNGTGVFGTLSETATYLKHLRSLLKPNGQILIDSSDLQYMYDTSKEGGIWVPQDRYYGELEFTLSYKGETSEPFPWLYLDERIFETAAIASGFIFEVMVQGENFDYLTKLSAPA